MTTLELSQGRLEGWERGGWGASRASRGRMGSEGLGSTVNSERAECRVGETRGPWGADGKNAGCGGLLREPCRDTSQRRFFF